MTRAPGLSEATVRAFRDLTAASADGAATRARVLGRAQQEAARRVALRRASPFVALALVALSSASAAWTAAGRRWRAPAPTNLETPVALLPARLEARAVRMIPSLSVEPAPEPDVDADDAEARAYGRAHRAHFVDDGPARALAAWTDYLAAYPRGTFAPEARYNRALCLIRLGRFEAAARALRGFVRASPDGYRRDDAVRLLGWLEDRIPDGAQTAAAPLER